MSNRRIVISEAAFKRLTSLPPPPPKEEVKDDAYYMRQLAEKEIQHSQSLGVTEDNFWSAIEQVEEQVGINKPRSCAGVKSNLLTCLKNNDYHGLQCSDIFQQFSDCLQNVTNEILQNQELHKTGSVINKSKTS